MNGNGHVCARARARCQHLHSLAHPCTWPCVVCTYTGSMSTRARGTCTGAACASAHKARSECVHLRVRTARGAALHARGSVPAVPAARRAPPSPRLPPSLLRSPLPPLPASRQSPGGAAQSRWSSLQPPPPPHPGPPVMDHRKDRQLGRCRRAGEGLQVVIRAARHEDTIRQQGMRAPRRDGREVTLQRPKAGGGERSVVSPAWHQAAPLRRLLGCSPPRAARSVLLPYW